MKDPKRKKAHQENPPQFADDDDDFQSLPLTQTATTRKHTNPTHDKNPSSDASSLRPLLKPSNCNSLSQPPKKPKRQHSGKENEVPSDLGLGFDCCLDSIQSTMDLTRVPVKKTATSVEEVELKPKWVFDYSSNSIESRLIMSNLNCAPSVCDEVEGEAEDEDNFQLGTTQLDVLLQLCSETDEQTGTDELGGGGLIQCPMCGLDIANLNGELRQVHTNECLDNLEAQNDAGSHDNDPGLECNGQVLNSSPSRAPRQAINVSSVLEWLRNLGLAKYENIFIREEIDWDSLQWLTEEDLCNIGVTALGPRKKIIHALSELRKEANKAAEVHAEVSIAVDSDISKLSATKLITDYFPGSIAINKKVCTTSSGQIKLGKTHSKVGCKQVEVKKQPSNKKLRDIPVWCHIPETPFRVDAFKYLRRDCFHWFLTHFHTDHYQGLTKSFCHGKIYCSLITAKLVNLKIGITWDKLEILPLNQKISISGIDVTCFDANHCPGSIIVLFEPPSGKAVLHTGDFRFSEEMAKNFIFQNSPIHTLILDTTYCDPQYDFPKQEAVIQFVIEAIQAESFNPKTLFLIGSYTIGKERLFLEVARVLRKKVYVPAGKLRVLESLEISEEDMHWFTSNELESHIHVVPMWTLASFKRLKHISNQYTNRFSLIVAFSPTGWTFGKGKKSSPGRRCQQGTIIRYEVPYSEHCSFTELREFVKLISPMIIVPSVNNHGPESTNSMVSLLLS